MKELQIKSNYFKEYLLYRLNKYNINEIDKSDLLSIKELEINKLTIVGKEADCTLEDLVHFTNVEKLTIKNFNILKNEMKYLEKLKKIRIILFERCNINTFDDFNSKIESMSLNTCTVINTTFISKLKNIKQLYVYNANKFDFKYIATLKKLESLKISNGTYLNMQEISNMKSLKQLFLQGLVINSIDVLKNLNKLEYLNLNGTVIKQKYDIKEFSFIKEIEQFEKNIPIQKTWHKDELYGNEKVNLFDHIKNIYNKLFANKIN